MNIGGAFWGRGREGDAPWSEGSFVPFPDGKSEDYEDLSEAENVAYRHVVYHALRVLFALDFEAVLVSGQIDERPGDLHLVIFEHDYALAGAIVVSCWAGHVRVEAREGHDVRDAVRLDFGEMVARRWMESNGYHPDYPCDVATAVDGRGNLTVRVSPKW